VKQHKRENNSGSPRHSVLDAACSCDMV